MKWQTTCLCALLIVSHLISFSQDRCGFDEMHAKRLSSDPFYKKRVAEVEKNIQDFIKKNRKRLSAKNLRTTAALYTIPVVVHVMHTGGAIGTIYNPSDAQLQGAIDYLNQVYNGSYPGTQGAGDIEIQFALAVRDPNCNSTNGINRVDVSGNAAYVSNGVNVSNSTGINETTLKDLGRWSSSDYYNIWVVNKIDGADGTSGTFVAGFAWLPGTVNPNYDGTVILATQMQTGRKTLPHEIGHAFGLYHPFQGGDATTCPTNTSCNSQGDYVCDTDPITIPSGFTCRTGINTCTGTAYNDNTESNYMNYTNCYNLFTTDQKARMLAAASSIYRIGLSVSSALTTTNILYPYSYPVASGCTPVTNASWGMAGNYAGILGVQVNNKEYYSLTPSLDGGYLNNTNDCIKLVQVTKGGTYDFASLVLNVNTHQLRAWIDYNNDGNFDNTTEQIHFNASFGSAENYLTSGTFLVPNSATTNTVLRLRVIDDLVAINNACHNPTYGQAEDYPVYIQDAIILPVTLLNFNGQIRDERILLNWSTSNEQNLKSFDIEKSTDGVFYYSIGRLSATGTGNGVYSFDDPDIEELNFYRLRMTDFNGSSNLSSVIRIDNKKAQQELTVRNPFNNIINVKLLKAAARARLQLINVHGSIVNEKTFFNTLQIDWEVTGTLNPGIYILRAVVDGKLYSKKIIRE